MVRGSGVQAHAGQAGGGELWGHAAGYLQLIDPKPAARQVSPWSSSGLHCGDDEAVAPPRTSSGYRPSSWRTIRHDRWVRVCSGSVWLTIKRGEACCCCGLRMSIERWRLVCHVVTARSWFGGVGRRPVHHDDGYDCDCDERFKRSIDKAIKYNN